MQKSKIREVCGTVSVVIAAYNGAKYIERQLSSIAAQTVAPDEVLIFDDRSSDSTAQTVCGFIEKNRLTDWKFKVNEQNKGYCINFFDACLEAKGDIIFLCDQDDVWDEEKLEKMLRVMERNPDITALCCSCRLIDGNGQPLQNGNGIGVLFEEDDGSLEFFSPERFVGRSFIRGCSLAFRREVLQYLKPLELKGLLSHDWLITFASALCGSCAHLKCRLMSYRCHGENNSFGKSQSGKAALDARINGLENSIVGHSFVLKNAGNYPNMTEKLEKKLKRHIAFEQKRIDFLKSGGLGRLFACLITFNGYSRYYGSFSGGVRVLLGDVSYRLKGKRAE